jgi:hypothetical protein
MVVASGQLPYQYDGELPVRQKRGAWPGIEVPNIGPSGDLFEQGMFVLNAELRKWNITQLDLLTYQAYTVPTVASSGFEPKSNGETFQGQVGPQPLLAINNLEQMRENLEVHLFGQYAIDSDYGASDFLYSWLTSAYPESPSGYPQFFYDWIFDIGVEFPATWLRPVLTDITDGNFVLDTDLHWLGGSGTLFDIDYGEVIFNPFPFPRQSFHFNGGSLNPTFSFGPLYPTFQTTAGTGPSVDPARYQSDLSTGTFKAQTNFEAIQSGYWQMDGYVLLPGTLFRLTEGNDSNYFGDLGTTTDFNFFVSGQRRVADGAGRNDGSARVYLEATPQNSGVFRINTTNPKSVIPFTSIPSGYVSFWPNGDIFSGIFSSNRMLDRSVSYTSDGGLKLDPRESTGFHVLDDALWFAGPNASNLSGTFITRGLTMMSPYNGEFIWYRPAERIVATSGNQPGGPAPIGSPGIFGVHVGLEEFGTDFVRISRVWNESLSGPTTYTNTIYFQRYDQTTLNHTEQSETWTIDNSAGEVGNRIDGLIFDGTDYFIWDELQSKVHRFNNGLTYTGTFTGEIARRRHYAGGQLLYTIGGNVTVGDPLLAMTPPGGSNSGIGVWSITTEPPDITLDVGTYTHNSAKRLRAETHFGHQSSAIIHSIREISGATHVPNGIWMLIQFGQTLYLCKIREDVGEWVVEQSIRLDYTANNIALPSVPTDFPFEFILHNID